VPDVTLVLTAACGHTFEFTGDPADPFYRDRLEKATARACRPCRLAAHETRCAENRAAAEARRDEGRRAMAAGARAAGRVLKPLCVRCLARRAHLHGCFCSKDCAAAFAVSFVRATKRWDGSRGEWVSAELADLAEVMPEAGPPPAAPPAGACERESGVGP
jgi:hypothetical protein